MRGGGTPLNNARPVRRGEIYYIDIPHAVGCEIDKNRPGIVVSRDARGTMGGTVQVVYCSASAHHPLQEHVTIRSTPRESTALCESIYTVDKSRLGAFLGRCTEEEMEEIDQALLLSLGLEASLPAHWPEGECRGQIFIQEDPAEVKLARTEAERDTYKTMYESLLNKTMEAALC